MARNMLIDAIHPEETRVVVLSGNRLEEFDYETATKKQLKGNIYLAKVTRVEPSLQAAFVDYGGSRHGFLPFNEIHPDYYRIPIADRKALIAEEAAYHAQREAEDDEGDEEAGEEEPPKARSKAAERGRRSRRRSKGNGAAEPEARAEAGEDGDHTGEVEEVEVETKVDTVGGDEIDEPAAKPQRAQRRYKIQEVIKRRQVILVQVTKEERGNKGAALTTYLSLAGRYCVLMPNTNKGGGISRKISNASDRRRLKKVISELSIPEGMAVIVRTAGSERTKLEIRRDYEYLLRLWDEIREETLRSTAPALIYEEANLIKRAIRDLYSRDMDKVLVAGDEGYKHAKDFMKSLMPSHARFVQQYKDPTVPLFQSFKVERQLDDMHNATVQLKSGGYIVINPTEALVAIDVNSGKATRERHIEETALKTNQEAAEEIARQLRLRDLAGLIVIDFIDMEEGRHNRDVERRLKDAMRHDRARIQLGRISPFGLLEMSRQRLRPSLFESSTVVCPHCHGTGHLRSTDSAALHVLRAVEEEGVKRQGGKLVVTVPTSVALYMLNQKRDRLMEIEQRFAFRIEVERDDALIPPDFELKRVAPEHPVEAATAAPAPEVREEEAEDDDGRRRRRRRRGRRRDEEDEARPAQAAAPTAPVDSEEEEEEEAEADTETREAAEAGDERPKARRRRGKRGGRRRSRRRQEGEGEGESRGPVAETAEAQAAPGEPEDGDFEPEAESVDDEAPETAVEADASSEAEPQRAKRRPRRRRGGKTKTEAAEAPARPTDLESETASAAPEAPEQLDLVAPETPAGPEAETPAATPEPLATTGEENGHDAEAEEQAAAVAERAEDSTLSDEPDAMPDDDRPKRRGWWNRLI